jgi:hypothetical protein
MGIARQRVDAAGAVRRPRMAFAAAVRSGAVARGKTKDKRQKAKGKGPVPTLVFCLLSFVFPACLEARAGRALEK